MTLKIYPIVLQLVRRLSPYLPALRARSATLGRGKNRQVRYQSAAASAREALACLETAEALGWVQLTSAHSPS
jgi:hypothetical protein